MDERRRGRERAPHKQMLAHITSRTCKEKKIIIYLLKLSKSSSNDPRLVPLPLARFPPPVAPPPPPPPPLGGGPRSKSNKSIRTSSCLDDAVAPAPPAAVAPEDDVTVVPEPPVAVLVVELEGVPFVAVDDDAVVLGGDSPKMDLYRSITLMTVSLV